MKKIFLSSLLFLTMSLPYIAEAVTKSATINWSMPTLTNVQGYKLYYSYSSGMENKVWHQDCGAVQQAGTNEFSMTCSNINITAFPVYFTINAVTSDGEASSAIQKEEAPISVVKNFGIVMPNVAPTATISASTTSGAAPLTVSFNAMNSTDSDGTIASYSWNFGDGNSGAGATISHTFSNAGTFPVALTITDNDGATGLAQINIQTDSTPSFSGDLPFAYFTFSGKGGTNNDQILDSVSNTWTGAGAATGTFSSIDGRDVLLCSSNTCRVGVPANNVMGAVDKLTIETTYKSALLSYNYFPLYYSGGGDSFTFNLSSSSHNCSVRTNYSSTYATASFPAASTGTWHTTRTLIDFSNKSIRVFMDGVELPVSPNTVGLANWGTLSGNLYFAFINDASTQNLIIDEVKIWHGLVTP